MAPTVSERFGGGFQLRIVIALHTIKAVLVATFG
jgi:hypothetical protein